MILPLYDWACEGENCDHTTQVRRNMSDYEIGPDDPCPKCGSVKFKRFIAESKKEQWILKHGGKAPWFAETVVGRFNNGR